jgi:uncharacterized protein (TIGR02145 family)
LGKEHAAGQDADVPGEDKEVKGKNTTSITKIGVFTALLTVGVAVQGSLAAAETPVAPAVTDIDGNAYKTVAIGSQVWMAENLKTTRYRNGDAIGTTSPAALDISSESAPKYQWAYAGDENNVAVYGRLYTWYAVTDGRKLCPVGWHVPSDEEWSTLIAFLGGPDAAVGKLKEVGTAHWKSPNSNATNASGFTGLPGGNRLPKGGSVLLGEAGHYWTASEVACGSSFGSAQQQGMQCARRRLLLNTDANPRHSGWADKKIGWSVRCLKD